MSKSGWLGLEFNPGKWLLDSSLGSLSGILNSIASVFQSVAATAGFTAMTSESVVRLTRPPFHRILPHTIGVIAIRVLAGGVLSGSVARHVNAARTVDPVAAGQSFADDVKRSQRFDVLIQEGYVDNLIEAAVRFVIGKVEVSTVLIGISDLEQLEQAVEYGTKGPLPAEALRRLQQLWGNNARPAGPYTSP